jgi:segregation and condensation protein B
LTFPQEQRSLYKKIIEALLFCAGKPLKIKDIQGVIENISPSEIENILEELKLDYSNRGLRIVEVANGYRVESAPEVSEYLKKYFQPQGIKWTRALLETLAIIAYFQPISRAEISAKRGGVEVGPFLKSLLERGFIKIVGRKAVPGRPALYGTTSFFLEYFGLKSLEDLPPLGEMEKLLQKEAE